MKKILILIVWSFMVFKLQGEISFKKLGCRPERWLGQIVIDALDLHYNLFSRDIAKVLTGFVPCYLFTRLLDEDIQSHFYDSTKHKNINQFHNHCHTVAKVGVGIPMVFLSTLALWGWTEDICYTGRMTAIGLPFVHSSKDVIKHARARACLRPWHENFSSKERSSGGFPSGHMANVTYLATLWGLRHGPRWAIPLSFLAGFVFADFINQNRHYLSQMVAGAAFGAIYAVAASNVVENRLLGNFSFSVNFTTNNRPCCEIGYTF